ncbi:MAG: hypothetical protein U5J82_09765 [Desulfobacterales bacterium]|nr:hypothetical protein [Desulfobacterales bacterium]
MSANEKSKSRKVLNRNLKMEGKKNVYGKKMSLTVSIAKSYRDRLRTMAAQQNLHDPDKLTSASTIARENYLRRIDNLEFMEETTRRRIVQVATRNEAKEELPLKKRQRVGGGMNHVFYYNQLKSNSDIINIAIANGYNGTKLRNVGDCPRHARGGGKCLVIWPMRIQMLSLR